MGKTKRIHILRDDADKLAAWFNFEDRSTPAFQPIFHRAVEVLEHFFEYDGEDVLDSFKQSWAVDEANENHEKENQ